MKAIQCFRYGGVDTLGLHRAKLPTARLGDLLVQNVFASINFHDTYCRSGLYQNPSWSRDENSSSTPFTLGLEGAGVVKSAPANCEFSVGDKVVYAHPFCGSYADCELRMTRTFDSAHSRHLPVSLSYEIPRSKNCSKRLCFYIKKPKLFTKINEK